MSVSIAFGRELPRRQPIPRDLSAFRILVIGDFGAGRSRGVPLAVDRDDLDQVLQQFSVRLRLKLQPDAPEIEIAFSEFDDFHPDRLFQRLDVFAALRTRRERLLNDATCRDEIAAIVASAPATAEKSDSTDTSATQHATADSGDLLSQVLSGTQAAQKPLEQQILEGHVDWDAYVRQLVSPYVVPGRDPRQAELLASVDEAIAGTMRAILHHPEFQALESAWHGLRFLTRRLETDRLLQLSVMDLSFDQLTADLNQSDDLTETQMCRLLIDSVSVEDAEPWTIVVGNYQFGASAQECVTLARLARICEAADCDFVAAADPAVAGCPGFAEAKDPTAWAPAEEPFSTIWKTLRTLPVSRRLCLTIPRIMARLPYGAETNPIESFSLTELPDARQHDQYLWMNGAFGVASLAGLAFSRAGWQFTQNLSGEIDRLPLHWYSEAGEDVVKPCAELELTSPAAEKLAAQGLTVLRSVRNEDSIRIAALRSLSLHSADWPQSEH